MYRLITDSKMEHAALDTSERAAVVKLHSVLDRDPDDLAVRLSEPEMQAEEWLGPLPATSIE